jgi:hypothetical protein
MESRASIRPARIQTGVMVAFVALIAAFLLGGTGGYLVRGLTLPSTSTTTYFSPHPFVIEQAPYSAPSASPVPEPMRDPGGNVVPI